MPSNRVGLRSWIFLIGALVFFALVFLIVVPYRTQMEFINRRTCHYYYVEDSYWGLSVNRFSSPSAILPVDDPGKLGWFVPDTNIVLRKTSWHLSVPKLREEKRYYPGERLEAVALTLFTAPGAFQKMAEYRHLSREDFQSLMDKRIALWNSSAVDLDPDRVIREIREENKILFPRN
jgi:hypothetical protein